MYSKGSCWTGELQIFVDLKFDSALLFFSLVKGKILHIVDLSLKKKKKERKTLFAVIRIPFGFIKNQCSQLRSLYRWITMYVSLLVSPDPSLVADVHGCQIELHI